jgi:hypothetical protein
MLGSLCAALIDPAWKNVEPAMNLVSTIMHFLAPAIVNKIAGSLGLNQGIAGKLISAAIPAILAGLTGAANKSGGGGLLSQVLSKQDPNILDGFAGMLGGAGQQKLVDGGTGALSSLLGGSSLDALAGALGKFGGVDQSQGKSLAGMLAPVVLGSLAKEQRASGLDAGGLTSLLNGQKSNVSAAIPAGFADLLKGSGLLDAVSGQAGPSAPRREPAAVPGSGPGMMRWLLPAALAGLALYFVSSWLGGGGPGSPPSISIPAGEVASKAKSTLDALTSQLAGITDEASAKSALPRLQAIAGDIDSLKKAAVDLPAEARHPLIEMVGKAMPGLAASADKVMAIPGVASVLKPVMDQIMASLGSLKA